MKHAFYFVFIFITLIISINVFAQVKSVSPSLVITGTYLGETPPLRDLPTVTDEEWQLMVAEAEMKILNPKLRYRSYPYAETALPKGPDPVWQRAMGTIREIMAPIVNFNGQDSPSYPPDCNGTAGQNYFMQTVNKVYAIYDKTGALVAGPANLNTLFSGVIGSNCNDGDPIVLYDEQADRWLVAEFSICGANDYMLVAVSTTNDPTGTWHKYSFDVADMPDYEKFGIWQDGYYMGTNNNSGNDIYVFERSKMLTGQTAQAVGFDNPWRPTTVDGFMCVPPLDNDGPFAPDGEPGLFITLNDDAIGGGSDQLWIYELDVDWTTPTNSNFTRTQQISVAFFDSNFGTTWDNIRQLGTTRELDAIPQVIMNPPQYRNFGSYETIVCCHTVDVNASDQGGIRWYELRRVDSGEWTVRQQGTYAPDTLSRWMGSIMLNAQNEIAIGYSVSSKLMYPAIRYAGQSASAYNAANGILDIAEESIQDGVTFQSANNRWGDYSSLQIDPVNNATFWFTNEYIGSEQARKTRIASFNMGTVVFNANFVAGNTAPPPNSPVSFYDLSVGGPTIWSWSFSPNTVTYLNGTSSSSKNPQVSFNNPGFYTVSLTVSNDGNNDTETKANLVHVFTNGLWNGSTSSDWNTASNWDGSVLPTSISNVVITASAVHWPVFPGNFTVGTNCNSLTFSSTTEMTVNGNFTINAGETVNMTGGGLLIVGGDWTNNGNFISGVGTVKLTGTGTITVTSTFTPSTIITYNLSTFTAGMTALSESSTGPDGDDGNSNLSIGFDFIYAGTTYSSLKLSTNGWVSLNQSGILGHDNVAMFTTAAPNATIGAWWDDLYDDDISFVYYKTEGTAPDRVFTAEWNRLLTYYTGATARVSFQIKLFETSNKIEYHYGTVEPGTHHESEGASIAVEDATGGPNHFKEATTGSTTTGVTNLQSASNWPTVNYRYTPQTPGLTFANIIINNSGGTVQFPINTTVTGNFQVLQGGAFAVSTGKTLTVQGTALK